MFEGLVDAQGSGGGRARFLVLSVLYHVRCLAATSSCSPEVSCPASLGDSVSLDWFTRLCHINGVQLGSCNIVQHPSPLLQSVSVTCLARSLTTRGQSCPFCNQSLSDFARSASFQASSLFHGCMIDVDAPPTNRGINYLTLPSGFPRPPDHTTFLLPTCWSSPTLQTYR